MTRGAALLGLAVLAATAAALAPPPKSPQAAADPSITRFEAIQHIVALRCAPCHAAAPTQPGFAAAPKGLLLDSPEAILAHVSVIGHVIEPNPTASAWGPNAWPIRASRRPLPGSSRASGW